MAYDDGYLGGYGLALLEGEWRLIYPSGVNFSIGGNDGTGLPRPVYHHASPDLGDVNWNVEDAEPPRRDGTSFGSDYFTGRVITFSLAIQSASEAAALTELASLAKAWRGDGIRQTAGATATLATRNAGRERLIYGRPRRFGPPDQAGRKAGLIFVDCDFQCAGQQFYALAEDGVTIPFIPPPGAGFVVPFTVPLSTVGVSTNWGAITVDGEDPVSPIIKINGPITNPIVAVVGQWSLQLLMSISAGQSVIIDTRPWRQSVIRLGDGASFAGKLTKESRIDRASLAPGDYNISLGGLDGTGTSTMNFNWRKTYASI
jgi:hypothetical protein